MHLRSLHNPPRQLAGNKAREQYTEIILQLDYSAPYPNLVDPCVDEVIRL